MSAEPLIVERRHPRSGRTSMPATTCTRSPTSSPLAAEGSRVITRAGGRLLSTTATGGRYSTAWPGCGGVKVGLRPEQGTGRGGTSARSQEPALLQQLFKSALPPAIELARAPRAADPRQFNHVFFSRVPGRRRTTHILRMARVTGTSAGEGQRR